MGTTADKLQALIDSKEAIKTAINNKGGSVLDSTPLDEYATAIGNLPSDQLPDFLKDDITDLVCNTTSITSYGCSYKSNLTSVTLPNLTRIPDGCFRGCTNLSTFNLSSNISYIGQYAFALTGLTSITLDNLFFLLEGAFNKCYSLTSVELGPNLENINTLTFVGCLNFTDLTLKRTTVVNIADTDVFYGVTGPITVHVPANLISLYRTATNWSTLYNNGDVTFVAIQ